MAFLLIGSLVKPAAIGVEISAWHPNKFAGLFSVLNFRIGPKILR